MPSLKDLRGRIRSVKQTQKITSAMKLVAASKLKRAQEQAEASRPFAEKMAAMLANLGSGVKDMPSAPPLLAGRENPQKHLIVVATADRGLAGGFNATIVRGTRRRIAELRADGKEVKLICVGRKGRDMLRREYKDLIIDFMPVMAPGQKRLAFTDAEAIAEKVIDLYEKEEVDVVSVIYNTFKSAVVQILTRKQLIPVELPEEAKEEASNEPTASYDFEPNEERILGELLPRNVAVQIYGALVENNASEQGARMAAMDNATRNAGDMIKRLSIQYNRQRQAQITKELIEIISGAEAL